MPDLHLTAEEINAWDGLLKARQHLTEKVEEKLKQSGLPPYSWYDVLFELEKMYESARKAGEPYYDIKNLKEELLRTMN